MMKVAIENEEINTGSDIDASNYAIPVINEHIKIGKKVVETGRVHISKKTVEEDFKATIQLLKEEVLVERKPVNQYVDDTIPQTRVEGDTTIIPVIKEVMVKRLLLVEEVYITKLKSEHTAAIHEALRKEEVTVTRKDSQATGD